MQNRLYGGQCQHQDKEQRPVLLDVQSIGVETQVRVPDCIDKCVCDKGQEACRRQRSSTGHRPARSDRGRRIRALRRRGLMALWVYEPDLRHLADEGLYVDGLRATRKLGFYLCDTIARIEHTKDADADFRYLVEVARFGVSHDVPIAVVL